MPGVRFGKLLNLAVTGGLMNHGKKMDRKSKASTAHKTSRKPTTAVPQAAGRGTPSVADSDLATVTGGTVGLRHLFKDPTP